jgi:hypothetical protein
MNPLPGAKSRGVAFSEWESYRTDAAGQNILVTTDDSNFFRDRDGKLNGNTGDTDASGLNVTDAADSVILGTESADQAPWQVDPPSGSGAPASGATQDSGDGVVEAPDAPDANPGSGVTTGPTVPTAVPIQTTPAATAAVAIARPRGGGSTTPSSDGSDFPYYAWVRNANSNVATSVHTDEGTTLASGADAFVIGGDGYDDDDNRAAGNNIVITRDDDNVVIGGTGDVNAQIGDSEQGAVIMGVQRVFVKGGGAY